MPCEKIKLPDGSIVIACSRGKKPNKRTCDNALEMWAITGLAVIWRRQACTGSDDVFCKSIVEQWESTKKLTGRQWNAVVVVARRYKRLLGEEPSPNQGGLL